MYENSAQTEGGKCELTRSNNRPPVSAFAQTEVAIFAIIK